MVNTYLKIYEIFLEIQKGMISKVGKVRTKVMSLQKKQLKNNDMNRKNKWSQVDSNR